MDNTLKTNDNYLKVIKDEIVNAIQNNKTDYVYKNKNTYEVRVINLNFVCCYTDDEINKITELCLELLEELRHIHESGFTREKYNEVTKSFHKDKTDIFEAISLYNTYKTEKIEDIIENLGKVTRVGGAYFLLLSKPTFICGINSVIEFIIDRFEDVDAYFTALFILVRMAMHMHCDKK